MGPYPAPLLEKPRKRALSVLGRDSSGETFAQTFRSRKRTLAQAAGMSLDATLRSLSAQMFRQVEVERDPDRGRAPAARLKAPCVKGILVKAAEQGYTTQVACKM